MDVRCEKCGTEYELDEARLKPGGVTVKCTTCGHMFKIRKRAATNVGMPAVTSERSQRAQTAASAAPSRPQTNTGSGPAGDRNWIIRLPNGDQRTCQELATLQQWIVQGEVKRDAMISRSGKTWKQLGDIPELAQFFGVAEEARQRRDSGRVTGPHAPTRPRATPPPAAKPDREAKEVKATLLGMPATPANDATVRAKPPSAPPRAQTTGKVPVAPPPPAPPPPPPRAATPSKPVPQVTAPLAAPPPTPQPGAPVKKPASAVAALAATQLAAPDARSTGAWATDAIKPPSPDDELTDDSPFGGRVRLSAQGAAVEPQFGGQVRSLPTTDVAFASNLRTGALSVPPPSDDERGFGDDDLLPAKSGGAGKWIAIVSLLIIAGAATAGYFAFWKPNHGGGTASGSASAATVDAAVVVSAKSAIDAGVAAPPAPDAAVDQARAALRADDPAALDAAAAALGSDQNGLHVALRARISTEIAQDLADQANVVADTKAADKLRKDSKQKVADALILAQKAVKLAPDEPMAHIAMADVLRLQGKDPKQELSRAPADDREAQLVQAMADQGAGKLDDAKKELTALDVDPKQDLRPRFRLALLAYAQGDATAAQQAAEDVQGVLAGHAGAQALLARIKETVVASDPMPPEEDHHPTPTGTGTGTGTGSSHTSTPVEPSGDYDSLLKKADDLAQNGHCDQAMDLYAKALDQKSNGVAALTGRGYCFIDGKQFSSAFSSFRAALAVSPKYEPALWGMAEAYQQQGLKDKAIEAYMNYLEVYPDSAKAKKQLDKLGANPDGSSGGSSDSGGGDKGGGAASASASSSSSSDSSGTGSASGSGS